MSWWYVRLYKGSLGNSIKLLSSIYRCAFFQKHLLTIYFVLVCIVKSWPFFFLFFVMQELDSFFFFGPLPFSMQDLNSPTRSWTHAPAVEVQGLNHWTAREISWLKIWSPRHPRITISDKHITSHTLDKEPHFFVLEILIDFNNWPCGLFGFFFFSSLDLNSCSVLSLQLFHNLKLFQNIC